MPPALTRPSLPIANRPAKAAPSLLAERLLCDLTGQMRELAEDRKPGPSRRTRVRQVVAGTAATTRRRITLHIRELRRQVAAHSRGIAQTAAAALSTLVLEAANDWREVMG